MTHTNSVVHRSRPVAGTASRAPVFLIGAARSGTSLTYKVLSLHPELAYISNWVARYPRLPPLAALNRLNRRFPARSLEVWFGKTGDNAYVYGKTRPTADRVVPMPAEAERLYRRCGIPELPGDPQATDRDVERLRRSFEQIRRWAGGRALITKRVADNRRIPTLLRAFPDARFIEIVRDGRAVAASLRKVDWWDDHILFWAGASPAELERQGEDPWAVAATNWVEEVRAIEAGRAAVPAAQWHSIGYEDFIGAPGETIADMVGFLGLSRPPRFDANVGGLSFPNQNERWRQALGAEAIATIERIQRADLARYGYA